MGSCEGRDEYHGRPLCRQQSLRSKGLKLFAYYTSYGSLDSDFLKCLSAIRNQGLRPQTIWNSLRRRPYVSWSFFSPVFDYILPGFAWHPVSISAINLANSTLQYPPATGLVLMGGDSVRFSILDFNAHHLSNLGLGIMILYRYFLSLARFQLLILPQKGKRNRYWKTTCCSRCSMRGRGSGSDSNPNMARGTP